MELFPDGAHRASLMNTAWALHRLARAAAERRPLPRPARLRRPLAGDEGGEVLLRHGRQDTSFLGVTADSNDSQRAHWVVEAIAPRQKPPILPAPVPASSPFPLSV
nr:unnamed protein product [Digitaria exilis]